MTISIEALNEAIKIKEEILRLELQLNTLLDGDSSVVPAPSSDKPAKKRRRKMSAAGRAKIAAAQRARWAKTKNSK